MTSRRPLHSPSRPVGLISPVVPSGPSDAIFAVTSSTTPTIPLPASPSPSPTSPSSTTPIIDPFPSGYECQDDEIDLDRDDRENHLATEYQKARFPSRFDLFPLEWTCNSCHADFLGLEDVRHHCYECGDFDLCEGCYKQGNGFHLHNDDNFFYRINNSEEGPDWLFSHRMAEMDVLGGKVSLSWIVRETFRNFSGRHFIGLRRAPEVERYSWFRFKTCYALVCRLAVHLRWFVHRNCVPTAAVPTSTDACSSRSAFVGLLSEMSLMAPLVWFACQLSVCAFVPIQRVMPAEHKATILSEIRPRVIFVDGDCVGALLEAVELWRRGEEERQKDLLVVVLDDGMKMLEWIGEGKKRGEEEEETEEDEGKVTFSSDIDRCFVRVLSLSSFLALPIEEDEEEGEEGEADGVVVDDEADSKWDLLPQDYVSIVYSSGTTRKPKGVPFTAARWHEENTYAVGTDYITLLYLPLSHLTGLLHVLCAFLNGGRVAILCEGDMTHIFDDFRLLNPTSVTFIPRLLIFVLEEFHRRCRKKPGDEAHRQTVFDEMREIFGNRVLIVSVGTAPCAPKVKRFIRRLTRLPVEDGYGITEAGSITVDHKFVEGVEYKLLACPELGYSPNDVPYPRGELLVRSQYTRQIEYFGHEPEKIASRFDSEGYFHTGDIVELRGAEKDRVIVVDRRGNVVKLSQGEFCSLERVEAVLETSPLISVVILFPNPSKTCFLAIVVLLKEDEDGSEPPSEDEILDDMRRVALENSLAAWTVPAACHFVESEELPLTSVKKKSRGRIKQKFAAVLEEMNARTGGGCIAFADSEKMAVKRPTFQESLISMIGVKGKHSKVNMDLRWEEVGGDSLRGALLMSELRSRGLVQCSYSQLRLMRLREIVELVEKSASFSETGGLKEEDLVDLEADFAKMRQIVEECRRQKQKKKGDQLHPPRSEDEPLVIFLTGASGFLGQVVLDRMATQDPETTFICLVRPSSRDKFAAIEEGVHRPERVEILIGDLALERFGLEESDFVSLASRVTAIIHIGACVNHFLGYEEHHAANVRSSFDIVRLSGGRKPIVFVSSMSVFTEIDDGEESEERRRSWNLKDQLHFVSDGYPASKFAADRLFSEFCSDHCMIVRAPFILGSEATGTHNGKDWLCRSLGSMLRVGAIPTENVNENVPLDMISVDVIADFIGRLVSEMVGVLQQEQQSVEDDTTREPRFPPANLAYANVTVGSLLGVVAEFFRSFVSASGEEILRLPFPAWIELLESRAEEEELAIRPFLASMKETGYFGFEEFVPVEMSRFESIMGTDSLKPLSSGGLQRILSSVLMTQL